MGIVQGFMHWDTVSYRGGKGGTPMTTIETRLGPVNGLSQNGVFVALGIPYAAPRVAEGRWMPPMPADPWPTGLDAT